MESKAEDLYEVWKTEDDEWIRKFKELGSVSEEDVNGFLRLVKEKDKRWRSWKIGYFVSKVLEICYKGKEIHLDVALLDGAICVGELLDWDGVIYVNSNVNAYVGSDMKRGVVYVNGYVSGKVGWGMKGGFVIVDGSVEEDVGYEMKGGLVVVNGEVSGYVGLAIKEGAIVVNGCVSGDVGEGMNRGIIVVEGDVGESVGFGMKGGEIIVDGVIKKEDWMEEFGEGVVVVNGFVYFGRWCKYGKE